MISANRQRLKYIFGDYISSNIAWLIYNCIRYEVVNGLRSEGFKSLSSYLSSDNVVLGQVVFPLVMMMIYLISGYYNDIFRKSRVQEFLTTLYTTFINTLIIFFIAQSTHLLQNLLAQAFL